MNLPIRDGLLQIFDVEHGACALLTSADTGMGHKRLLIDCGHNATTRWTPGLHLQNMGIQTLEMVAITNYDEDHVSGYPDLLQRGINVDWILRNPSVAPETIRLLKSEDGMGRGIETLVTHLGSFDFSGNSNRPLPVFPGVQFEWFYNLFSHFVDENNLSLVLLLNIWGRTFLFPGDMECEGFEHLLGTNARFRAVMPTVDILVASHHGRRNGICELMFDTYGCRPKLVVISDDYKQFDTQETVSYYGRKCLGIDGFREPGVRKVLTTRNDGEIRFTFYDGQCTVQ